MQDAHEHDVQHISFTHSGQILKPRAFIKKNKLEIRNFIFKLNGKEALQVIKPVHSFFSYQLCHIQ